MYIIEVNGERFYRHKLSSVIDFMLDCENCDFRITNEHGDKIDIIDEIYGGKYSHMLLASRNNDILIRVSDDWCILPDLNFDRACMFFKSINCLTSFNDILNKEVKNEKDFLQCNL